MKRVSIGSLSFSKVICGANPFYGHSHFGAGRIPPDEGLQFIAENAKPSDLVAIGFGTEDEVSESVELVEKLF